MSRFGSPHTSLPRFGLAVFVLFVVAVIGTSSRATGRTLNLRTDERNIGCQRDDGTEAKRSRVCTTIVYRVDAPSATTWHLSQDAARDSMLAYALRDEIATVKAQMVPSSRIFIADDHIEIFDCRMVR